MKKSKSFYLCMISLVALFALFMACGGGGGGGGGDDTQPAADIEADVEIIALQFAEITIFSVTVNSVTGVADAASFNLLGDETRPNTNLGETADNFVQDTTSITMEIYDSSDAVIASAILDAADYTTTYEGTLTLSAPGASLVIETDDSLLEDSSFEASEYEIYNDTISITQIGNLDILAYGIIDVLPTGTRSIVVPLYCGQVVPGDVTPNPDDGFFIINDVIIEYYYALANAVVFNDVLSVKFRESGRNFENMTLAFRLPNSANIYRVRPKPFKLLTAAEAQTILDNVVTAVNTNNPFETAIAYVDLEVTPFGPVYLVETIVTSVEGDCVAGAQSFTVQEGNDVPEPYKEFLDQVDKNTTQEDLILLILGNKVQVRDQELTSCGDWSPTNSGGAEGTLDLWDISAIAAGASFDFSFDAYSIPDIFVVEYPVGTLQLDSGWRGSSLPDSGEPLEGPGAFEEYGLFVKGTSDTISVLVTGEQPGTAWEYSIRCNDP